MRHSGRPRLWKVGPPRVIVRGRGSGGRAGPGVGLPELVPMELIRVDTSCQDISAFSAESTTIRPHSKTKPEGCRYYLDNIRCRNCLAEKHSEKSSVAATGHSQECNHCQHALPKQTAAGRWAFAPWTAPPDQATALRAAVPGYGTSCAVWSDMGSPKRAVIFVRSSAASSSEDSKQHFIKS